MCVELSFDEQYILYFGLIWMPVISRAQTIDGAYELNLNLFIRTLIRTI